MVLTLTSTIPAPLLDLLAGLACHRLLIRGLFTASFHGTLTDGSVFDSSVERGQPATFGVSQVIAGWTEALQLMRVGDKWRLFIPPNLAYGEASPTPAIPPNSALIFDVELLEIR